MEERKMSRFFLPVGLAADHSPEPASVTIAGSMQSEFGCPGDWQPDCAATHMVFDASDDIWRGVFALPAGVFEYKAALNDSWNESHGGGASGSTNIPLGLDALTEVSFYYDHRSHWVTDNVNSVIATAAGNFQSELGCPGDWQPDCLRSWLQDPDGDGLYVFSSDALSAGSYELKVTLDETWNVSYPAANVPFAVGEAGDVVTITYDATTNAVTVVVRPSGPIFEDRFESGRLDAWSNIVP
jgi:pullulanase